MKTHLARFLRKLLSYLKKAFTRTQLVDEFWGAIRGKIPKIEYAENLSDLLQMGIRALLLDDTAFSSWPVCAHCSH